jgi:hypothetical protein
MVLDCKPYHAPANPQPELNQKNKEAENFAQESAEKYGIW